MAYIPPYTSPRIREAGERYQAAQRRLFPPAPIVSVKPMREVPIQRPRGSPWSTDEDATLLRMFKEDYSFREVAEAMRGRSAHAVHHRARDLGLRRGQGWKSSRK